MSMIPSAVIAKHRARFASVFFTDTVTIIREVRTRTDTGGTAITTTTSTVSGKLSSSHNRGQETPKGGYIGASTEYVIHVPHDADVRRTDKLQVNGVTFEVTDTDRAISEPLTMVCQCKKL